VRWIAGAIALVFVVEINANFAIKSSCKSPMGSTLSVVVYRVQTRAQKAGPNCANPVKKTSNPDGVKTG
jgi:hypothetical protein